ncbi:MAG TPA: phage major capsid protein [Mycobacteriales bacterium]|nr:phage major capsid protein [Mycobacteriales bacterium]
MRALLLCASLLLALTVVGSYLSTMARTSRAFPALPGRLTLLRVGLTGNQLGDVLLNIPDELRGKTVAQLVEIRDYLGECLRSLHQAEDGSLRSLNDDESASFNAGLELRNAAEELIKRHNQIAGLANTPAALPGDAGARGGAAPGLIVRNDPYDLDAIRFSPFDTPQHRSGVMRDHALRAIEAKEVSLTDEQRSRVEKLVRRLPEVAERVLVTGSPGYREAFAALWDAALRGQQALLTADQARFLQRAASLTNNAGGYAVPFTLDPTVILTQAGSLNPIRQIGTVKMISTDVWKGVTSAGITVSWDGEAGEVSDDSPTIGQPSIQTWKAQGFVPFSIEIGQDWAGFEAEMQSEFQAARDVAEAAAFALGAGDGSHQPEGIVTKLAGGSSQVSSATTDTFAIADVYATYEKPAARYRSKGSWLANMSIYDKVRQFGTANNYHAFWTALGGGLPSLLLERPVYESPDMDGSITADAENYALVFGDFSQYVIVDRVGMNVELVPHLFATANNRPSGQRGLYAWWRVGGGSVNDAAFALLDVT